MRDLQLRSYQLIVVEVGRNLLESVKQVLHLYRHLSVHQMAR
jgi:hypothetical protein